MIGRSRRGGRSGICHITTSHPPGDTRIWRRECASLVAHGYDVELVVVADDAELTAPPDDAGVPIRLHRFPVQGRLARLALRPLLGLWLAIRSKRGTIHIHDPEMMFVAPLLKLFGRRVVYDVHEDYPRQMIAKHWLPRPLRRTAAATFEVLENWCTRRLDVVVAATDSIGERFDRIHPSVFRVRNYASMSHFGEPIPLSERRWDVCYVGTLNPVRGVEQMQAVADRTGARMVIAGRCQPTSLGDQLRDFSRHSDNMEYLGAVPHTEAVELMRNSRIGLLLLHPVPNHIESQPNKLFEYMAAGAAVVASDFELFVELIEGNEIGEVVDPMNADAAVASVKRLLDDPERLAAMGASGRRVLEERYSWEVEVKALLDAYAEVAERPVVIAAP